MAKFVVCPLAISDTEIVLLVIVATELPSVPVALSVMLFVKNEPTVPTKLVGEVKDGADAPEQASNAPIAALEPRVQRKTMAKLELAAGAVTMFRSNGRTCSAAARSSGNIWVSLFMKVICLQVWIQIIWTEILIAAAAATAHAAAAGGFFA